MPRPLAHALAALALALLAAAAHGRLLGAGYRAPDAALLARAEAAAGSDRPGLRRWIAVDPRGSALANRAHAARARDGAWRTAERAALAPRLAALALLAAAAAALGLFGRRLLVPYVGVDHAAAAGTAAAALAVAHPVGTSLIADAAALDDLGALALGLAACAAFLRGRQERRFAWTAGAWLLAALAALAGELAWGLFVPIAAAELTSAHRYRPRRERLRTAANTVLFFGAGCALGPALHLSHGGASRWAEGARALTAEPGGAALELVRRAAALILPVNPHAVGAAGAVVAGVVVLLLLHPAVAAARAAPRLWSRMLCWWLAFALGASAFGLDRSVGPEAPSRFHLVAGGAFALALGLGAAATALSGRRRRALPWIGAAALAALSAAGASPWLGAARAARELALDLQAARELYGADARVLVLDAPLDVGGVETLGREVAALSPAQAGVTALSSDAFLMLAYEPELDALRAERLVVLAPLAALPGSGGVLRPGGSRRAVRLERPSAAGSQTTWRDARSPVLDLDTHSYGTLIVRAALRSDPAGARTAHWRVTEPSIETASAPMVFVETGDEPILVCDLGGSLAWRLGDRARRVWIEGRPTQVVEARLEPAPPAFDRPVEPATDGADWIFPRPSSALGDAVGERGAYALTLLSLGDLAHREIEAERFGQDLLRVPGAAAAVAAMELPVAWHLELRLDGVPLARERGRRGGRDGTVEVGAPR